MGHGTDVDYRSLVEYWRSSFAGARRKRLNAFPQFKITPPTPTCTFCMCRGKGPDAAPVVARMAGVGVRVHSFIPRLTDPAAGGDPATRSRSRRAVARLWTFRPDRSPLASRRWRIVSPSHDRHARLRRFAVQGGDWGAITAAHGLRACTKDQHSRQFSRRRREPGLIKNPDPEEQVFSISQALAQRGRRLCVDQGTRPQTLSFG